MKIIFTRVKNGLYAILLQKGESGEAEFERLGVICRQDTGPDKYTIEDLDGAVISAAPTLKRAKAEASICFDQAR